MTSWVQHRQLCTAAPWSHTGPLKHNLEPDDPVRGIDLEGCNISFADLQITMDIYRKVTHTDHYLQ